MNNKIMIFVCGHTATGKTTFSFLFSLLLKALGFNVTVKDFLEDETSITGETLNKRIACLKEKNQEIIIETVPLNRNIDKETGVLKNISNGNVCNLQALNIAYKHGGTDEAHHKSWVIDQMVRALCGTEEKYQAWIKEFCDGKNGSDTYKWDEGITP